MQELKISAFQGSKKNSLEEPSIQMRILQGGTMEGILPQKCLQVYQFNSHHLGKFECPTLFGTPGRETLSDCCSASLVAKKCGTL
jgi:hypothetical protein